LQASGYSFLYSRTVSPSETSIKTSIQSASFTIHKYSVSLSNHNSHTTPNNFLNHITQTNSTSCAFSRQPHHSSRPTRNPGTAAHQTNQPRADLSPQRCYSPKRAMTVPNPVRVDNGGSSYLIPCMSRYSLAPRPSPNILQFPPTSLMDGVGRYDSFDFLFGRPVSVLKKDNLSMPSANLSSSYNYHGYRYRHLSLFFLRILS
jgi:hypothetical protein